MVIFIKDIINGPRNLVISYGVDDVGRVFIIRKSKVKQLKTYTTHTGHVTIRLIVEGKRVGFSVHRLVATAFMGPCPKGMEVHHINGVASDNRVENLIWCTHAQNMQHKFDHDTVAHGKLLPQTKLTEALVKKIRAEYSKSSKMNRYIKKEISQQKLASKYKVTQATISRVIRGESFNRVR